jgi:ribosomal-protein-serine acetyltransferase
MFRLPLAGGAELRMLEARHVEELYELTLKHKGHLRAWLPWAHAEYTVEDTRAYVQSAMKEFVATGAIPAGIWYGDGLVGVIGMHTIDWADRSTSLGYWMSEDFQGRGFMRAAFRAVLEYAFDELELHRVEVRCATGNTRSRSFPEKANFTHEGTLRQAQWLCDRFVDMEVYSLLATEWRSGKR